MPESLKKIFFETDFPRTIVVTLCLFVETNNRWAQKFKKIKEENLCCFGCFFSSRANANKPQKFNLRAGIFVSS